MYPSSQHICCKTRSRVHMVSKQILYFSDSCHPIQNLSVPLERASTLWMDFSMSSLFSTHRICIRFQEIQLVCHVGHSPVLCFTVTCYRQNFGPFSPQVPIISPQKWINITTKKITSYRRHWYVSYLSHKIFHLYLSDQSCAFSTLYNIK